jgi:hypothetical protein
MGSPLSPTAIHVRVSVIVIKPDVSEAKQLDDGIDDTFVPRWGGEVSFAID